MSLITKKNERKLEIRRVWSCGGSDYISGVSNGAAAHREFLLRLGGRNKSPMRLNVFAIALSSRRQLSRIHRLILPLGVAKIVSILRFWERGNG